MRSIGRHINRSFAVFGVLALGTSLCRMQRADLFVADQSGYESKLVMN